MPTKKGFFALRLRELRDAANLTQAGLAERSGLATDTIRQFEYGRRIPGYDTLVKLAAGLGVSLSAFDPPAEDTEPKKPRRQKGE